MQRNLPLGWLIFSTVVDAAFRQPVCIKLKRQAV
jgi:hypothetical protein